MKFIGYICRRVFLSEERRLNSILKILLKNSIDNVDPHSVITITELKAREKLRISEGVFKDLLRELHAVGYVVITTFTGESNIQTVYIRDKGREFIKNGGYVLSKLHQWWNSLFKSVVIPISVTVLTTFIITYIKHEGNNTRDIKYMIPTQQTELLERHVVLLDSNYTLLNQKVNHVEKELNIQKK